MIAICAHGAAVMAGHHNLSEQTAELLRDNGLHTGEPIGNPDTKTLREMYKQRPSPQAGEGF